MANLEESGEQSFAEALDLPPERRTAFLDQACKDAPELRRLVDALLRDHQRARTVFLTAPCSDPWAPPPRRPRKL